MYDKNETYLMHHGVPGQKWGTRRWQNPDGSLTAEGRAHYGVGDGSAYSGKGGISKYASIAKDRAKFAGKYIGGFAKQQGSSLGRTVSTYGKIAGSGAKANANIVGSTAKLQGKMAGQMAGYGARTVGRSIVDGPMHSRKATREDGKNTLKEMNENSKEYLDSLKESRDMRKQNRSDFKDMYKENKDSFRSQISGQHQANKEFTQNMVNKYGADDIRRYKRATAAGKILVPVVVSSLVAGGIIIGNKAKNARDQREMNAASEQRFNNRAEERSRVANENAFDDELNKRRGYGTGSRKIGY